MGKWIRGEGANQALRAWLRYLHLSSYPNPVLAGLEIADRDGLKILDVRRRHSRLVSKISVSVSNFKEPQSGPACGSPFFCLLFFGEAKKSELLPGNPGTPRKAQQQEQSAI